MPSRFEAYRMVDGKTPLAAGYFNPIWQELDLRLVGLEELRVTWLGAVAEVQELGLARINELVGQPMETVNAAILEMEQRIAALPEMVSTAKMQEALAGEAKAREAVNQALLQLVEGVKNTFPPQEGHSGKFLSTDGEMREWTIPAVTDMTHGTAQPLEFLGIDEGGRVAGLPPVRRLDYEARATLRNLATGTAIVRGLGVFEWDATASAADIDDDTTLFVSSRGCWRMLAPGPEATVHIAQMQMAEIGAYFVTGTLFMQLTTLAAGGEVVLGAATPGVEAGFHAFVAPDKKLNVNVSITVWVEADGVMVALRNHSANPVELTPGDWAVMAINPRINS